MVPFIALPCYLCLFGTVSNRAMIILFPSDPIELMPAWMWILLQLLGLAAIVTPVAVILFASTRRAIGWLAERWRRLR